MSPWHIWRHMREAEGKGEALATQKDLALLARDVAKLVLWSQALVLAAVIVTLSIAWYIDHRQDVQRDTSFRLVCGVSQQIAGDTSAFAGAVVRLIPPTANPPLTPSVRAVRTTAVRVRDNQKAFAAAKCDNREDLARLLEQIQARPTTTP